MVRHVMLLAVLLAAAAAPASADVLEVYGEAHGGGMYGKGSSTDQAGFFEQAKGGAYGLLAGARFLFLDAHVLHHQYPHDGKLSTWTQFNAGLDFEVDTGSAQAKKDHNGGYVEIGAWVGFGLATGAQVDPPLNNAQVSDKGFMAQARFGFGKHLNKIFDIGVEIPGSWGYIFRNGNGATANDTSSQYQSIQVEGLLVVRANIKLI